MKRTAKAAPRPKDPPDDEPGPQLLTQKRAANQVEQLYLDLARIVGRLEGLLPYVDAQSVRDAANALTAELKALMGIRARLLTGEIPITRGEDRKSYADRQPLIAAIEARTNGNGHAAAVDLCRMLHPQTAGRQCKDCGEVRPAKEKSCPRCGGLKSTPTALPALDLSPQPAEVVPPSQPVKGPRKGSRTSQDASGAVPAGERTSEPSNA